MVSTPIHTGNINGHPVRFFKTPLNDGKPDFAWHSTDDLMKAANLSKDEMAFFMQTMKADHPNTYRTIATNDGLVTVAPHFIAQGFTAAMEHVGQVPKGFKDEYLTASFEADDKLPFKGFDEIAAAFHRHSGAMGKTGGAP